MTTIEYTHSGFPDSSAVDEVYYNENTNELTLCLHGVYYRYSNVFKRAYDELMAARSKGRFYREHIQRLYKPARRLGWRSEVDEIKNVQPTVEMPTGQSRHTEWRNSWQDKDGSFYAQPSVLPRGEINGAGLYTTGEARGLSGHSADAGTPKALVETPNTVITNVFVGGEDVTTQKYEVNFVVGDSEDLRTHNLKASSVEEALDAVYEIGDMLDLTFKIKSVTIYFE